MIQDKPFILPEDIDLGCVALVVKLNQLPGIETTESCSGHLQTPYMIFFQCNDFIQLGRLYRCVNHNYSDGKWRIECCCSDTLPTHGFLLKSNVVFETSAEMLQSVSELIKNIDYWQQEQFNEYFMKGLL